MRNFIIKCIQIQKAKSREIWSNWKMLTQSWRDFRHWLVIIFLEYSIYTSVQDWAFKIQSNTDLPRKRWSQPMIKSIRFQNLSEVSEKNHKYRSALVSHQAMTEAAIFTIGWGRIIGYGKIQPLADYRSRSQLFIFSLKFLTIILFVDSSIFKN